MSKPRYVHTHRTDTKYHIQLWLSKIDLIAKHTLNKFDQFKYLEANALRKTTIRFSYRNIVQPRIAHKQDKKKYGKGKFSDISHCRKC